MVQRKVANKKLGIQAEDIKSEKLVVSLKPSCTHSLQDIKNKGADLKKKKMKKSASIKRPDVEILRSSGLRKRVELPGKPPPVVLQTATATPKKQPPIKGGEDVTPNYMKSTSSSDARKERAQVSSQSLQSTTPDRKRHSKNNTATGNKTARTLTRASSLKLVRTLTKTPSFKLSRGPAKRHSQVILCENLDVQKATCSSTMKEHKFPDHLTLSPGATEAEGTSALKVCPYSYCSLNGHHHQPLPPLKSFLSARRRMLKGQRNLKIGCLSPRRANPVRDILKEIEAAQVNNEAEPSPEECGTSSTSSQLKQEGLEGFFVEIYSKEWEDASLKNQDISDSSVADDEPPIGTRDESKTEIEQAEKSPSTKFPGFEVDYEQRSAVHSQDVNFVDMDVDGYFPEEENNNGKIAEEIYPPFFAEGKTLPDFLNLIYELEAEYTPSIQSEEADLDTSDMDWEAGLHSAAYPLDPSAKSIQINQIIDLEKANSALDNAYLDDFAAESGENLPDEISQEPIDDETASDDEAFKRTSLVVEENEGCTQKDLVASVVPGVGSLVTPQQEDVAPRQMGNEDHHEISGYVIENISNSIGIQTDAEFEYPRDMSGDMDEVQKRSIGIQTDDIEESQSDTVGEKGNHTNKEDPIIEEERKEIVSALMTECSTTLPDSGDSMEHTSLPDHGEIQPVTILSGDLQDEVQDRSSATQYTLGYDDLDSSKNENDETTKAKDLAWTEDQTHSQLTAPSSTVETDQNFHRTHFDHVEDLSGTRIQVEPIGSDLNEDRAVSRIIRKGKSREIAESDKSTEFNPRAPNFLPIQPDPEAEKVDLKHLDLDENKNADEWMLDHALQQAVTKLAPARKRKVALLVEAFETVLPVSKCETRQKHTSAVLSSVRSIQACS